MPKMPHKTGGRGFDEKRPGFIFSLLPKLLLATHTRKPASPACDRRSEKARNASEANRLMTISLSY